MRLAHFAFDFRFGDHGRDRVDHHDIHRAGAYQRLGDLKRLFAGIRLRNKQGVNIHAQRLRVHGVERVLHVDEHGGASRFLRLCGDMQRDCGFSRAFRPEYFDDAPFGNASDSKREVKRQRACGDRLHNQGAVLAELHDRSLAKLLFDLAQRGIKGFLPVLGRHVRPALRNGHAFLFRHRVVLHLRCCFLLLHYTRFKFKKQEKKNICSRFP